ncbi:MAG TPA: DNA topoisomerase, partial [Patescibacteria group bacterium]|nr:DNA topoisomerase [Patescibacteria group bacterium]
IEEKESFDLYDGKYQVTKTSIKTLENADQIISELSKSEFTVEDISQKELRRSPLPPFTTSTLQQEASRRFGYSGKRTMSIAQKLYEEGFITYHRTDSVTVGSAAVFALRGYAEKEFGKNYVPEKPRFYKTKQKLAQEAHEAIRPTNVNLEQSSISGVLGHDAVKLYDLIFKRAVGSQMADAVTQSTSIFVLAKNAQSYRLKANGSVLKFPGFLKLNPQALNDNLLPDFKVGESLKSEKVDKIEHETPPPPRYNDASLIATLEEKGIGRPSTYATIIGTIEERQYVEKEEGRFAPTSVGIAVNDFLVANFSTIDDIPFTAEMEDQLDSIVNGGKPWVPIIRSFYEPFEKILEKVENAPRVKIEVEETDEICEKCGAKLVVRVGRFGKFLACSTFPKCDFTKPFMNTTEFICPKDGGKIVIKKTKKGRRFYGCSNYPKCDFAAWKLGDIKKFSPEK